MGVKTNLVTRSPSERLRLKKSQVFRRALGGGQRSVAVFQRNPGTIKKAFVLVPTTTGSRGGRRCLRGLKSIAGHSVAGIYVLEFLMGAAAEL